MGRCWTAARNGLRSVGHRVSDKPGEERQAAVHGLALPTVEIVCNMSNNAPKSSGRDYGVFDPLHEGLVGRSHFIEELDELIHQLAPTKMSVLITGESGTGKDIVARLLHRRSDRRSRPFIKINCPAIPDELVESELFGYEKGAFTGAHTAKPGRFELAADGTIFLDEITEISDASQAKLLTVLDGEAYMRIGGVQPIQPNARVVTATNVELDEALASGKLRRDVYARLSEFVLYLTPLRERSEDIPLLAEHFNYNYSHKIGKPHEPISDRVLERMSELQWHGNIRALSARVKEYVATGIESVLMEERAPANAHLNSPQSGRMEARRVETTRVERVKEFTPLKEATRIAVELTERALIEEALHYTLWNRRKAAKLLDISYSSLLRRIDAYGIGKERGEATDISEPV